MSRSKFWPAALAVLLAGCQEPGERRAKVIVGPTILDGTGAPPLVRGAMVVSGSWIRGIGTQASTPIPAGSEKTAGTGKYVVPVPIEIPADFAAPKIQSLAEAKAEVDKGATVLDGMIADTDRIDGALLTDWRRRQVVFVPRLYRIPAADARARAQRNVRRLIDAGVAVAAERADWPLLAEGGLAPAEILVGATRDAARALQRPAGSGTLIAGQAADLLVLAASPLEDVRNVSAPERVMRGGEWVRE